MAHALIAQGRRNPQAEAIRRLAQRAQAIRNRRALAHRPPPDVVEWAHKHFYIVDPAGKSQLIQLTRLQQALLRFLLQQTPDGRFRFSTIVWSTIKKSGKTAISAMVARWASETWGRFSEIYCMANDLEQAKGRAYQAIASSVEMTPGFDRARRHLPGQWTVLDKVLHHIPSGGTIKAVATDYAGEAGSNPSLTLWCVPVDTPILTADLRWVEAGGLSIGQRLVGFEEESSGFNLSRQFRTATITAMETKALPCLEIELEGDAPLRATPEHRWLVRRSGQNVMFWKRTEDLRPGDELAQIFQPWEIDRSYDAGYVAGALDGEGHLSELNGKGSAGGYTLGLAQLPGKFLLEKVLAVLTEAGFPVTQVHEAGRNVERLRIDRKQAVIEALGKYRPGRLLGQFSPDRLGHIRNCTWREVRSVRDIGPVEMGCISTSTKTYIARGYGAHNTELWAYVAEKSKRLWTEMTPSPTRATSIRWVETYAGFEGESELLEDLYRLGKEPDKGGRQITAGELGDPGCFAESPHPEDLVPVYINENAGMVMYWDEGLQARRMPWQQGEAGDRYYQHQEQTLHEHQFNRLHHNRWSGGESEFVPMEWWDGCQDPHPLLPGDMTPLVAGVDASVTGDSTSLVVVSLHPTLPGHVCERYSRVWVPKEQAGGEMDYDLLVNPELDFLSANHNLLWVTYDPYQLHQWAVNRRRETLSGTAYREFSQGTDRLEADKGLYDLIRGRKVHHLGKPEMRRHVQNANAKLEKTADSKLRIVKRSADRKIDLTVALSMACSECLRLML